MDNKITIIEGPSPTFEFVNDVWPLSLNESPSQTEVARTTLRAANGAALVERCHRAWRKRFPMRLEFKSEDGIKQEAPIVAARFAETQEGDMLYLWVRFDTDEVDMALAYEEDADEDEDEWDANDSTP